MSDLKHSPASGQLTALVLAGDRSRKDPLLAHSGKPSKALIEIGGRAMVLRVLDTLASADFISGVRLSGPERNYVEECSELVSRIETGELVWVPPEATPSTSAHAIVSALPEEERVLLTTADHPLLTPQIVNEFSEKSLASGADVVVGLAPYSLVSEAFPELKKTVLNFSDQQYCGCNLFAFLTPTGRQMATIWREVETQRKTPRKVLSLLGIVSVLRYRFGWLSLDAALRSVSRRLGIKVAAVVLEQPEAAVDVDSVADHAALQARI